MHLAFLFTAHCPYVRRAGRSPAGEEELHVLIARSLVPLISILSDLHNMRLNVRLALALSPLLLDQLEDPVVQKHFVLWMESWITGCQERLERAEQRGDEHSTYLARFDQEWGRGVLHSFEARFERNLVGALRDLVAAGMIEPLAGAASYAYLPLLRSDESVRAQIEQGVLEVTRKLGRPQGIWLPGCGWRPGTEPVIAEVGLRYVVVDRSSMPAQSGSNTGRVAPHSLTAISCDDEAAPYIWSADLGYSGDPVYRAHGLLAAADQSSGEAPYDPYHAFRRAQEHATHFVTMLAARAGGTDKHTLVLIPLDAQLIGVRWFEGLNWFQSVLTLGSSLPALPLTTPAAHLRRHRPAGTTLHAGSWSADGSHMPWQHPATTIYWHDLQRAEERLMALISRDLAERGHRERLLTQAARELLLAQDSTWPLRIAADPVGASGRWKTYLERCRQLCDLLERPELSDDDLTLLDRLEEIDGPFPNLNYRIFLSGHE